jgi:hydrogenase maturation protease
MNRACVGRIANAVLYEGYILYPYRPSVKNRQRWTFGGLYPEAYCRARRSGDSWGNQTECLVHGGPQTALEVLVRFLHLTDRRVGQLVSPPANAPHGAEPSVRFVEALRLGDQLLHSWQEAQELEVELGERTLGELAARPYSRPFAFPGAQRSELVRGANGEAVGVVARVQHPVEGAVEVGATSVAEDLFRVTLRVINQTSLAVDSSAGRDEALLRTLASVHAVLAVRGGQFVSLLDPPECWRQAAADCQNVGAWPVLVGEPGQTDTMLSAPIILYDYPQVAAQSPGDFFDGTEIDEMLVLRILTLTDEEKRAMAAVDERAAALLARTEALAADQMLGLHGAVRSYRPLAEEGGRG